MGGFRLIHSHSRINVDWSKSEIRRQFLADRTAENDVAYDRDSMTGVWSGHLSSAFYEWSIEPDRETHSWIVHQYVRQPSGAIKSYALVFAVGLVLWVALYRLQQTVVLAELDLYVTLAIGGSLLLLLLYALYESFRLFSTVQYPDPLIDGRDQGFGYERHSPIQVLWLLNTGNWVALLGATLLGDPQVTLVLGGAYAVLVTAILGLWVADGGDRLLAVVERSAIGDVRLSGLGKRYAQYAVTLSVWILGIPLVSVGALAVARRYFVFPRDGVLAEFVTDAPHSFPLVDTVLLVGLGFVAVKTFRDLADEQLKMEYYDFRERQSTTVGRLVDASAVVASSAVIYAALLKTAEVVLGVQIPFVPDSILALPKTMFVAALLPMYPVAGVVYQYRKRSQRLADLLANSAEETITVRLDEDSQYTADVHVLELDDHYATSFTSDGDSHIVVTRGLVADPGLDDRALAAIVAHEEGHIEHGDTRLCNRIVVASSLLLVGQNVLYGLVDYRERERRADRYASEVVGADAVRRSLRFIRASEHAEITAQAFGANFAPQFDREAAENRWGRPFELFFGAFAVSDAHPSFDERLDQLSADDRS